MLSNKRVSPSYPLSCHLITTFAKMCAFFSRCWLPSIFFDTYVGERKSSKKKKQLSIRMCGRRMLMSKITQHQEPSTINDRQHTLWLPFLHFRVLISWAIWPTTTTITKVPKKKVYILHRKMWTVRNGKNKKKNGESHSHFRPPLVHFSRYFLHALRIKICLWYIECIV